MSFGFLTRYIQCVILKMAGEATEERVMAEKIAGKISIDPSICFGKPHIKGTRIPVYMILELLEAGYTIERILTDCYPQLTREDIQAAIHYAVGIIKNEDILIQETA